MAALKLPRPSMPHAATISRILGQAVDPEELERVLHRCFDGQAQLSQAGVVAIDGKTLRGTIPRGQNQGLHLLAAYLPGEGLGLRQVEVGSQENEIVAAPALLEVLDLRGKVVMGDALHTQRQLSIAIVSAGSDYVWLAIDNQSQLKEDSAHLFARQQCLPGTSQDYGHGRYETRTITTRIWS